MDEIKVLLPFPVSTNAVWRKFKNRMVLSERSKKYRAEVLKILMYTGLFDKKIDQPVEVVVYLHPPTLRKYDVDNYCKSLFDAIEAGGLITNDELIQKMTVIKSNKITGGMCHLSIKAVDRESK